MNVFWRELRAHRRSTVIWSIALFVTMIASMAKFETITAGGQAVQAMLSGFPPTIQAVFGMTGLDLTTTAGYFGVCFLFLVVTLAVHAGLLGADVIADDELGHTTEFLYVKPRSRARIISAKLAAGLIGVAVVWCATALGSLIGILKFAEMAGFWRDFGWLMCAAFLVQLAFFAIGASAASLSTKASGYGRLVTIVVFWSYFAYVLTTLAPTINWLRYSSLFSYFDARDILSIQGLRVSHVVLYSGIIIAALVVTYMQYGRRDLRV